jgi:hypothetical protein
MVESPTIANASQPNVGRMYDYFLGGSHNFAIDRKTAEQALKYSPHFPDYLKLIRWFLGEATRRLCAEGFEKFLDFASGLPTMDHIHQIAPKGTKVIYSDIDPITVAYGKEIIGDDPNIRYMECDAGKPEGLLNSDVVEELFGNDREVAIGVNGVVYFMPDEKIAHSLQVLYDWADEGSKLFLCDSDMAEYSENARKTVEIAEKSGQPMYLRSLAKTIELTKPWTIDHPGVKPLDKWIDLETDLKKRIHKAWGSGVLNGMILKKE